MSVATVETAVVADIDSILVKSAAALDKARSFVDGIDAKVQAFGKEKLVTLAEELTGTGPLAAIVLEIANGLDSFVDALATIADGVAANAGKTLPSATAPAAPAAPAGA